MLVGRHWNIQQTFAYYFFFFVILVSFFFFREKETKKKKKGRSQNIWKGGRAGLFTASFWCALVLWRATEHKEESYHSTSFAWESIISVFFPCTKATKFTPALPSLPSPPQKKNKIEKYIKNQRKTAIKKPNRLFSVHVTYQSGKKEGTADTKFFGAVTVRHN